MEEPFWEVIALNIELRLKKIVGGWGVPDLIWFDSCVRLARRSTQLRPKDLPKGTRSC